MSESTAVNSTALQQRFAAAMMGNYGVPPLALARGEGSHVWDADGNQYLDLIAGIATSALGHAHPAVVDAVRANRFWVITHAISRARVRQRNADLEAGRNPSLPVSSLD